MKIGEKEFKHWKPVSSWEELFEQIIQMLEQYYTQLSFVPAAELRREMFQYLTKYTENWWEIVFDAAKEIDIHTEYEAMITLVLVGGWFSEVVYGAPHLTFKQRLLDGTRYIPLFQKFLIELTLRVPEVTERYEGYINNTFRILNKIKQYLLQYQLLPQQVVKYYTVADNVQ